MQGSRAGVAFECPKCHIAVRVLGVGSESVFCNHDDARMVRT